MGVNKEELDLFEDRIDSKERMVSERSEMLEDQRLVRGVKGEGGSFALLVTDIWLLTGKTRVKNGRNGFFIIDRVHTIVITKLRFHNDCSAILKALREVIN